MGLAVCLGPPLWTEHFKGSGLKSQIPTLTANLVWFLNLPDPMLLI